MKKTKLTLFATAAMLLCGAANATVTSTDGYLTDSRGNVVKSATSDLCVRTSSYNKDTTKSPECDKIEATVASAPVAESKNYVKKVQKQFVAEVYFNFDKSELSLEDKLKIDRLVEEVKGYPRLAIQNVIVVGHADPIGTSKVNIPLSGQRAEAVVAYLDGRLPDVSTYAVGAEQNAVNCGVTATKKNIECNAENRRTKIVVNTIVDVVVSK